MSALHTQIMSKLAAGLEGAIRVASVVFSTSGLTLITVLMRRMTALHTKIVGELASRLEGSIRVTLEVVSHLKSMTKWGKIYTTVIVVGAAGGILVVVSSVASLSAQLLCEIRTFGEGPVWVAVGVLGTGFAVSTVGSVTALGCDLL